MDNNWTERTELLFGAERINEFLEAHVLVVGLGGVGGYAAEMLVRAGIGQLTIVDADTVQPSNLNRQLVALNSTMGQPKAEALAKRLLDINPALRLTVINEFLKDDNMVALLDQTSYDYVVDAIDSLSPKVYLIALSLERGYPIISSMGAGAKQDASSVMVADISKSYNCNLARALRKRLRKLGVKKGVPVVFSNELRNDDAVVEISGETCKRSTAGTVAYMPAIFGCHLSAYVIQTIKLKSKQIQSEGGISSDKS